jgi:hypothetical protein
VRIVTTAAVLAVLANAASAKTETINAMDNIYGAGQASAPGGGNVPTAIVRIPKGGQCVIVKRVVGSLSCASKNGCITLNSNGNLNDPDGVGAYPATSFNAGAGSIAGITAPGAGYLVGLFTPKGGPAGNPPTALDFTTGKGIAFRTLSPLVDQTFFIGDGRTGDDKGKVQHFVVPTGAVALTLGISDACNYSGGPGCYNDNQGNFVAAVSVSKAACP